MTDSVLMEVDNDPQVGEKRKADKAKAPMSAADEAKKNQMWVEKYRPSRLADVAAHKDIIDTISRLSTEDKLPHLLLYGPPGTGKTSTILALAKELYGASFAQIMLIIWFWFLWVATPALQIPLLVFMLLFTLAKKMFCPFFVFLIWFIVAASSG